MMATMTDVLIAAGLAQRMASDGKIQYRAMTADFQVLGYVRAGSIVSACKQARDAWGDAVWDVSPST